MVACTVRMYSPFDLLSFHMYVKMFVLVSGKKINCKKRSLEFYFNG